MQPAPKVPNGETATFSAGPDFSTLPDLIWLTVLQLLGVTDKYHVSVTCSRLYDLFYHPATWRTANLSTVSTIQNGGKQVEESLPQSQKPVARKFGHFLENVSIEARLISDRLEAETDEIITDLAQRWQLKFLKLRIMPAPFEGCSALLSVLSRVLQHAKGLQMLVFDVSRNPACQEAPLCVHFLDALTTSSSFSKLTVLHVCWLPDHQVAEASPHPLSLPPTVELVSKLPALQYLLVRSFNLSNQLLHELSASGRCQLRSLTVSVLASAFDDGSMPEVSSEVWAEVTSTCPQLAVHIIVKELVSEAELDCLFKPEAPIVSLEFPKKYFFDGPKHCLELITFSEKFASTLRSFVCSEDCDSSVLCDESLVSMATACSNLQHLVYNGAVLSETIIHLASLDRSWRRFVFVEKKIVTVHDVDDKNTKEERLTTLDKMCDFVSKRMGYSWRPLPS